MIPTPGTHRPTAQSGRLRDECRSLQTDDEMAAPELDGPQRAPGPKHGHTKSANGSMRQGTARGVQPRSSRSPPRFRGCQGSLDKTRPSHGSTSPRRSKGKTGPVRGRPETRATVQSAFSPRRYPAGHPERFPPSRIRGNTTGAETGPVKTRILGQVGGAVTRRLRG